jgi:hypothetical protein
MDAHNRTRDNRRREKEGARSVQTTVPLTIGAGVVELLRDKGAEEAFRLLCDAARECYSGLVGLEAELSDDPDEEGRQAVVLVVKIPRDYPPDRLLQEWKAFSERRAERIGWAAGQYLGHITSRS